jgi:hypothetical protein
MLNPQLSACVLFDSPYAKVGVGETTSPQSSFFSTRRGLRPRLVEKRKVLGGAPRGYPALQTSRMGAACVR